MGQVTKLANNIVGLGNLVAVCEGLVYAARAGAEPESVLGALEAGAANSWMLEVLGPKMFDRDFAPGFMVDTAQKDLRLILESADEMTLPLLMTPVVNQLLRSAQQMGFGREGTQACIKAVEKLAGVELERG
jgi:3-hydroxyisobutyrate dehydrogenase-like beta-hydroxyacid dehydrogenase